MRISIPLVGVAVVAFAGVMVKTCEREALYNAQQASWRLEVSHALETGKRARAVRDSLIHLQSLAEARADTLSHQVTVLTNHITGLAHQFEADSVASANSPLRDLLPALGMRHISRNLYGTDSTGVRFLENLRLVATKAELLPLYEKQITLFSQQLSETQQALFLADQRADTAEARVDILEGLLQQGLEIHTCRILFFPCPSRTTSLAIGAVGGVAIGILATR